MPSLTPEFFPFIHIVSLQMSFSAVIFHFPMDKFYIEYPEWHASGQGQIDYWYEMDAGYCPQSDTYCWEGYSSNAHKDWILELSPYNTTHYTNIKLTYQMKTVEYTPTLCTLEYDAGYGWNLIQNITQITDISGTYSAWQGHNDASIDPNSMKVRISSISSFTRRRCRFNEFKLTGDLIHYKSSTQTTSSTPKTSILTQTTLSSTPKTLSSLSSTQTSILTLSSTSLPSQTTPTSTQTTLLLISPTQKTLLSRTATHSTETLTSTADSNNMNNLWIILCICAMCVCIISILLFGVKRYKMQQIIDKAEVGIMTEIEATTNTNKTKNSNANKVPSSILASAIDMNTPQKRENDNGCANVEEKEDGEYSFSASNESMYEKVEHDVVAEGEAQPNRIVASEVDVTATGTTKGHNEGEVVHDTSTIYV